MSIFDVFRKRKQDKQKIDGWMQDNTTFKIINANQFSFNSWDGCLYNQSQVRAAVDAIARHTSKLRFELITNKKSQLLTYLKHQPNKMQTWSQFLYRTSTILNVFNTAIIVPLLNDKQQINGYYTIVPATVNVVAGPSVVYSRDEWVVDDTEIEPWITYRKKNGTTESVPLSLCCVLTRFQMNSDFFGESNSSLDTTMELIHAQNQAIQNAVKSSSGYKFYASISNFTKADDLQKERRRFTEENLSADSNANGLLLFPNTYANINQIKESQFVVPDETMRFIKESINDYFGVNENIIQNKMTAEEYAAFYEGCIEPFAIQISEAMTKMLFSLIERSNGNKVFFSTNRLQYLSAADKMNVTEKMSDRGLMTINELRDIWNMAPVEQGDERVIRGEYKLVSSMTDEGEKTNEND